MHYIMTWKEELNYIDIEFTVYIDRFESFIFHLFYDNELLEADTQKSNSVLVFVALQQQWGQN